MVREDCLAQLDGEERGQGLNMMGTRHVKEQNTNVLSSSVHWP